MKNIVVVTLLAISSLVMVGCEKEGEAEKAGKAIDDAFQDAGGKTGRISLIVGEVILEILRTKRISSY